MSSSATTPMMRQYWSIKDQHADALLFYRMGDFYELFFDDARVASGILDIALTVRGKHFGEDVPMCGVPVHSADTYLLELIRNGQKVAVCEQTEDPAEARRRGRNAVVTREVVRVITPGTLTEESLLDSRRNNFLAAWSDIRGESAIAWLDLSTGEFRVVDCSRAELDTFLARLAPRELLLLDRDCDDRELVARVTERNVAVTPLGAPSFDSASARERLRKLFRVASLDAFGEFGRADLSAMGAVSDYVGLTQKEASAIIRPPVRERSGQHMHVDAATRRNLELVETLSGGAEGSLLGVIDRTSTGAGARLLASRVAAPSTEPAVIESRLDAVGFFVERGDLADRITKLLRGVPDIERALSRLGLGRGGPRDLAALRDAFATAGACAELLAAVGDDLPPSIRLARAKLTEHGEMHATMVAALVDSPPTAAADGGFVRESHSVDLDTTRELRDRSVELIAALQESYRKRSGIASLRIRNNNVLGYFIEVRDKHSAKLRDEAHQGLFVHRQTTASAGRFTTVELSELEGRITSARAQAQELEMEVFVGLRDQVLERQREIADLAVAIAEVDLAVALGRVARDGRWCRPAVSEGLDFRIVGGRHPVVESALRGGEGGEFVANDCDLSVAQDSTPLWIVTGPNMAGKSTFLRQNALMVILAQAGSFVPAKSAEIGVVDRLFSRVGAADDLARGRSTFMVEMVETATILHQAGERSLVILDEIGRGTATNDGLSIAWAVLEYMRAVNRSRTLFATHFHELTELANRIEGVRNVTIRAIEWEGELVFLHEVAPGVADHSYGVDVARLAGLPDSLILRAREILGRLDSDREVAGEAALADLPLFDAEASRSAPDSRSGELERRLAEIEPDTMTPLAALDALYALKETAIRGD